MFFELVLFSYYDHDFRFITIHILLNFGRLLLTWQSYGHISDRSYVCELSHSHGVSCSICACYTEYIYRLRWSRGSVLAFGTQVRGFKPGRSHRIFKGEKIVSTPSFGGEVKPSVPCRRFAACKRSLELRGSRILGQNLSEHFLPTKSSTFHY